MGFDVLFKLVVADLAGAEEGHVELSRPIANKVALNSFRVNTKVFNFCG